jgi:hypothetical protein
MFWSLKKALILASSLLCAALISSSCDLAPVTGPTVDVNALLTSTAQSFDAKLTEIALDAVPTATPVVVDVVGTPIPASTATEIPSDSGDTEEQGSADLDCDRGDFIADVTIPDDTTFQPGETFVKTWRLRNSGACTWTSSYSVVFFEGDSMGSPASFTLTEGQVDPGEELEISVELTAPQEPGTYRGDWKLRNPAGQSFGLGSKGDAAFWTVIEVVGPVDVSFFFDSIHDCNDQSHAILKVVNNGPDDLESAEITVTFRDSGETLSGPFAHDGPFLGSAGECPPGGDSVGSGKTKFIGANLGDNNQNGQNLQATITICTADSLSGSCTEAKVNFTP